MAVERTNRPRPQAFEIDRLTGLRYNFDGKGTRWTTLALAAPAGLSVVLSDRPADLCLDTADLPA